MIELDGYEILDRLGETGSSVLLRARRSGEAGTVVLKLLQADHPQPEDVARLDHELAITRDLTVEGIVRPQSIRRFNHRVALVLEDVGGTALHAGVAAGGMAIERFLVVASSIARTLAGIHAAHVVHKDIKPANILVDGAQARTWITDFGFASRLPISFEEEKVAERIEGTLAYIAPEQTGRMSRPVDQRSDLYALGATFFELLTGRLPFEAQDALELVHCHVAVRPPSPSTLNPAIPEALSEIVLTLLAKAPEDRYQSAQGLYHDLSACLDAWRETGSINPFELRTQDLTWRLRPPERLYGREREQAELSDALDEAAGGAARLVLLSGPSGIGKTALVEDLARRVVERGGQFAAGKFDQFGSRMPYAPLIEAFRQRAREILASPPEVVASYRETFMSTLGVNAAVVADVLPDLTLILGEVPPAPQLGPSEAQNRFSFAFRQFIRLGSQPGHPLVIFFDDVHWADFASLKLLHTLITDPEAAYLLVVAALRPGESSSVDAVDLLLQGVDPAQVRRIDLAPLGRGATATMVSDILGAAPGGDPTRLNALADLVADRAAGNPFFVNQFLATLFEQGLVYPSPDGVGWAWDLGAVRNQAVTGGVVDLMVEKMAALPDDTREAMRVGALIGSRFDLGIVSAVLGQPPQRVALALWRALEVGMLNASGTGHDQVREGLEGVELASVGYRFVHDGVREASLASLSFDEGTRLHAAVGLLLHRRFLDAGGEQGLFEVLEHLNRGGGLLIGEPWRLDLAALNLRAAQKAKASIAYDTASQLLQTAHRQLRPEDWAQAYDLARDVHLLWAECLAIGGRVDEAEALFDRAWRSLKDDGEMAACCAVRAEVLQCAGQSARAYAVARQGLELLGVLFPADTGAASRGMESLTARFLEEGGLRRFDELQEGDARAMLVGVLFDRAIISAYFSRPGDLGIVIPLGVEHVLQAGITPQSSVAVVWMATILGMQGHLDLAASLAEIALDLAERFDDPLARGRVQLLAWCMCLGWKRSFAESQQALHDNFFVCQAAGDLQYASYSLLCEYIAALMAGRDCNEILRLCRRWLDFCVQFVPLEAGQARIRVHCLEQLIGGEVPPLEPGAEAIVAEYAGQQNFTDACESLNEVVRLETVLGNNAEACRHADQAEPHINAGAAGRLLFNFLFAVHHAVALCRRATDPSTADPAGDLAKADAIIAAKVEPEAALTPANFRSYALFARGERAWAGGDLDQATLGLLHCIQSAGAQGNVWLEAHASHRLAQLYRYRGFRTAYAPAREASSLYRECGAIGMAHRVEQEFPVLQEFGRRDGAPGESLRTSSTGALLARLDLDTVIKASQAIASEIEAERVMTRLIEISIESAGAERGVFVTATTDGLFEEAEAWARGAGPDGGAGVSGPGVPESVVRYVARVREPVVLGDATREGMFTSDPYILRRRPRSLFALPVARSGGLPGVLYLENTLAAGVFTPERLALLRLLSRQMDISLENARLYGQLEDKVVERTQELSAMLERVQTMQQQMVEAEKLAALGGLVAGVAHEINTPVGIAVTAASHLADQAKEFASEYEAGQVRRSRLEKFLATVGDATELVLTNLHRANDLVQSFKQVAVDQSSEALRVFEVRRYLEDVVQSLRPKLKRTPHRVEIECPPDLTLQSYPGAVAQIVTNLVVNSLMHAYDEGQAGTLRFAVTPVGGGVRMVYSDDGTGIPAEIQSKIFDPFFTTKRGTGGSGLGLHIVYNLVTQRLGGTISVQSTPAQGTTFTITLPTVPSEAGLG